MAVWNGQRPLTIKAAGPAEPRARRRSLRQVNAVGAVPGQTGVAPTRIGSRAGAPPMIGPFARRRIAAR
jgi:hypothetical protein